jgi:DNA-dependent protein kinase catalytic subunit
MQKILKVLDSIHNQFSNDWSPDNMPKWMQKLHSDYRSLNPSAKLFVLKLIIHRPEMFQNYAEYWFEYLAEYITSKDTGGKGFHYFLRDICTVLIMFSSNVDVTGEKNRQYCNEILNSLVK